MIILIIVLALIICLVLTLLIRAIRFTPGPSIPKTLPEISSDDAIPPQSGETPDRVGAAAQHLGEAISIRTISNSDEEKVDWAEFEKFHLWLAKTYPRTHETLEREVAGRASLFFRWRGKDPSLKPFAMLAHMDVVPVEASTLGDWTHPPFDGFVDDDAIWGRGASDMKNQLVALFESVEHLVSEGFVPDRDVYLCIGHNEEVQTGDISGARAMVRLLRERGVQLEFVLDEGGAVIEDAPFNVSAPIAMIGLAEKGYVDFRITVVDHGGHSAEPPPHTALGKLSKAITAIEAAPMKQRLITPVDLTFDALGRRMRLPMRLVLANLWLLKPLALPVLSKDRQTNAMTRTTIAATMAEASPASNVLPQRATANLNVRILPGQTAEEVEKHITTVAAKAGVRLEIKASRTSPAIEARKSAWAYDAILRCLPTIREGIIATPYLVTGATDSREYAGIADEIYRFYPFIINSKELSAMHATDERIRRESLAGALKFNYHFIKMAGDRK